MSKFTQLTHRYVINTDDLESFSFYESSLHGHARCFLKYSGKTKPDDIITTVAEAREFASRLLAKD